MIFATRENLLGVDESIELSELSKDGGMARGER
jgi:hypothetical protein